MNKIVVTLLLSASMACNAETAFVQSQHASVYAEPTFNTTIVGTLPRGAEVAVGEAGQRWSRVSSGDISGWVSKFLLSDKPPLNRVSVIGSSTEELRDNARRRASSVTTAGAARGLTADDRKRTSDNGMDYRALEKVENFEVSDGDVDAFIEQGLTQ